MMDYDGLNAKVKALRGRLLSGEDYDRLARLGSAEELLGALLTYPAYARCLSGLGGVMPRRGTIEPRLLLSLSDDFARIYRFIGDAGQRRFLSGFFLKHEITILKHHLSAIYDNRNVVYVAPQTHPFILANLTVNPAALAGVETVSELTERLRGTPFYAVLADENEQSSLFALEMKLDIYSYMDLWRRRKELRPANQKVMTHISGTEIDLRNIQWIDRLKTYYDIPLNELYAYLIPAHYRLKKEQLIRMAEAESREALWAEIGASPYGFAFSKEHPPEISFYRVMSRVYRQSELQNPRSLALCAGYLFQKETEIKNVVSLIEGVRYGLQPAEKLRYIRSVTAYSDSD